MSNKFSLSEHAIVPATSGFLNGVVSALLADAVSKKYVHTGKNKPCSGFYYPGNFGYGPKGLDDRDCKDYNTVAKEKFGIFIVIAIIIQLIVYLTKVEKAAVESLRSKGLSQSRKNREKSIKKKKSRKSKSKRKK